ncbi:MAG: class I SAM-dependent methyltransferase [Candidatus Sericytochromatia bacterium]|nr:class I SAM-dependent methyltransferase [Candidatus Sericytochromatia bacterium]
MHGPRDEAPHLYLGTELSPEEYYERRSHVYDNPHAEGIEQALSALSLPLAASVLDLGCGDGLVTKLFQPRGCLCQGMDRASAMVARYEKETGCRGLVGCFDQAMPPSEMIVASYALHLATPAEKTVMWWRMWESGASWVVVVSPFKSRPSDPAHYFQLTRAVQGPWGPSKKTVYGRLYQRLAT